MGDVKNITYSDIKDINIEIVEREFSKYRTYIINKYRQLCKEDLPTFTELEEGIKKLSSKPILFTNL